jgi:hypothetical protein
MAAPNLKTPLTITAKTAPYSATTTLASALSNSVASNKAFRIHSIRAANVDGVNSYELDISHYRGTTHTYLCKTITVPADATLVVLSREEILYLEEGDALYAKANVSGKIDLLITYEEIS